MLFALNAPYWLSSVDFKELLIFLGYESDQVAELERKCHKLQNQIHSMEVCKYFIAITNQSIQQPGIPTKLLLYVVTAIGT